MYNYHVLFASFTQPVSDYIKTVNDTVTLVTSEKSCHTEAESSSITAGEDRGLTFTHAAGDYEGANGEHSFSKDVDAVLSKSCHTSGAEVGR